jgi:hypothetical protein
LVHGDAYVRHRKNLSMIVPLPPKKDGSENHADDWQGHDAGLNLGDDSQ